MLRTAWSVSPPGCWCPAMGERRLAVQERELAAYVARAQTEIQRRESEWWQKQLGSDAKVSAA